ncbi:hypothetical protein [Paenibacillus apiarius]|uniref:hypothetical protein n=1 Tax=Paenibacillus apiarius TaxID=46240 RepID=UPI003B3A0A4A
MDLGSIGLFAALTLRNRGYPVAWEESRRRKASGCARSRGLKKWHLPPQLGQLITQYPFVKSLPAMQLPLDKGVPLFRSREGRAWRNLGGTRPALICAKRQAHRSP